jgi:hypothetical protein
MGIILSVTIVAVATYQNAKRDPEVFAQMGRQLEEQGQRERAIEQYKRAYAVNKQEKYLVDAARCRNFQFIDDLIRAQLTDSVNILERDNYALAGGNVHACDTGHVYSPRCGRAGPA